jgi:hypothetical protein
MRDVTTATEAGRDREQRPRSVRPLVVGLAVVWGAVVVLWIFGRVWIAGAPAARPNGTISAPPDPFLTQAASDAERALERHLETLDTRDGALPRVWGSIEPAGRRARMVVEATRDGKHGRASAEGDPGRIADEVVRLADEAIAALDR